MSKTATPTLLVDDLVFDLVDVMDEDNQDWLPLGEPDDATLHPRVRTGAEADR